MSTPTWEEILAEQAVAAVDERHELAVAFMENPEIRKTVRAEAFLQVVSAYSVTPRWRVLQRAHLRNVLMNLGLEEAGLG